MAGSRNAWLEEEEKLLIEHYDKPTKVLEQMFPRHSASSIRRKIIRLREKGDIGYRSRETRREAYRLRDKV